MKTKTAQAIHAAKHKLLWGRSATLKYAVNRGITSLYRLASILEAAKSARPLDCRNSC